MKIKRIFLLGIALQFILSNVSAAPIDSFKQNIADGVLTVSGTNLAGNQNFVIEIADKEKVNSQNEYTKDAVFYVAIGKTDESGSYEENISVAENMKTVDKAVIRIKSASMQKAFETEEFLFVSLGDVKEFVRLYNAEIEKQDIETFGGEAEKLLKNDVYRKFLFTESDYNIFEKYTSGELENFYKKLLENGKITVEAINDFKKFVSKNLLTSAVFNPKSVNEIEKAIYDENAEENFSQILVISETKKLDEAAKKQLAQKIYDSVISAENLDDAAFKKICGEAILVSAVKNAPYYTDVNRIMSAYNDEYLNIDFSDYNLLNDKYEVDSMMMGANSSYTDVSGMISRFNGLTAAQKEKENQEKTDNNTSSHSSGGGRGGFTGVINVSDDIKPLPSDEYKGFEDMSGFEWADTSVEYLYKKGIVSGVSETRYEPERNVSREEFLAMLFRAFDVEKDAGAGSEFDDVDKNAWYAIYVNSAVKNQIVKGKSEKLFGIGDSLSREDAAVMCMRVLRYAEFKPQNTVIPANTFSDRASISAYALYSVNYLTSLGVLKGDNNSFKPAENMNRAQAAAVIYRMTQVFEQSQEGVN